MSAMLKQKLIDIAKGFTKYGLWNGGSSKLSELNDVTLTNLKSNDVLTYNGSEWVNDDNLQTQINTLNSNLYEYCDVELTSGSDGTCWGIPRIDGKLPFSVIPISNPDSNYNISALLVLNPNGTTFGVRIFKNGYNTDGLIVSINTKILLRIFYN